MLFNIPDTLIIGHNIIRFDLHLVKKFHILFSLIVCLKLGAKLQFIMIHQHFFINFIR